MKIKTSALTGAALDWAVAKCENDLWKQHDDALEAEAEILPARPSEYLRDYHYGPEFSPSTDWAQGGPVIEREGGTLWSTVADGWRCKAKYDYANDREGLTTSGPTPLIAAMRCFCCSKLGEEIDVPEELLK